ncbi:hypothetical protein AVEN_19878-1 [Araneus ventricosus]|uniref:Uncharacterized protein n=1 Tax=Araneus ventricosus TaxID=182803 RepID=A0A4Y2NG46_ARAVE|nr:hypothetical protein AVEN_19878-1 [Araneus ventricosus]
MSVGGTEQGLKTPNIPQMFIYVQVGGLRRKEKMFNFIVMRFQPFLNTPSNVDCSVVILKELSFSREDSLDKRIEFIGPEYSDTDRLLPTHAREQIDQEDALRYRCPDHKGTASVLHSSQQNWKEGISGLYTYRIPSISNERIHSYSCEAWAIKLNSNVKNVILSTQRMFTLMICRAYRTTSTDSLLVLAGLEPVDLVIAREAAFTKVISFRVSTHCFGGSWESLYEVPPRSLLHPAHKLIPISL